jgi:hypothetical protein
VKFFRFFSVLFLDHSHRQRQEDAFVAAVVAAHLERIVAVHAVAVETALRQVRPLRNDNGKQREKKTQHF